MTAQRPITLPVHGLLELVAGLALVAAPFALGLSSAGMVLAIGLGVLLVGIAIGAEDGLPASTHEAFDQALVVGLAAAAVALASTGDSTGALVFAAATALEFALTISTRYSRRALRRR